MSASVPAEPTASDQTLRAFQWTPQPAAERLVLDLLHTFESHCPPAVSLAQRMLSETGTRFLDWVDSIHMPRSSDLQTRLRQAGFTAEDHGAGELWTHPGGIFPRIVLSPSPASAVWINVDSVADFLAANQVDVPIHGHPASAMRRAVVAHQVESDLVVVERHGWPGIALPSANLHSAALSLHHAERFRVRGRVSPTPREAFAHTIRLIDASIEDLGIDRTCSLFFAAEREYWQRRNRAAQVQKARQDALGLGWANHDHHTYRSSRRCFSDLIAVFERLGCVCRERFYAGREAGWGAQVLEQPHAGIVIFADVDLAPDELENDFAHEPLSDRPRLGTVGLWCALHGEAFLEAGMHHLECQFDFESLKRQLETGHGIRVMAPFTDLPFLRQAFTEGQRWPVPEPRIAVLLASGEITPEQAGQFRRNGALGSHLENLQRDEGYKGFNQQGVNEIIAATDPRRHTH